MTDLFKISGLNIYIQILTTLVSISVHLFATRHRVRRETVLELVTLYTIGLAGWFSIWSGLFGHLLYADEVAAGIGWPVNSGFQTELAFAAIGIGLVGALGFWRRSFWQPFIIAKTSFMWGAGATHVWHAVQHGNFSPSNTGIVVYWDFALPVVLIALYAAYHRELRRRAPTD